VMFASLAEGESSIKNFLQAEDPLRTVEAFRLMGIEIEVRRQASLVASKGSGGKNTGDGSLIDEIIVRGKGLNGLREPAGVIDCGNSGTTMRMMSGILAGQPFSSVLTGDQYLLKRPMARIIKPLTEMGAMINSEKGGYPPLKIKGDGLKAITYNSPFASAQVKSAVLLAGLYCEGRTTVIEPARSRDHTERMLRSCGANITVNGLEVSIEGKRSLAPFEMTVPGDLSSAAFFITAALIVPGSEIVIRNVGVNPTRTGIFDILLKMGGKISMRNKYEVSGEPVADVHIKHSGLTGTDIGGELIVRAIDEFPVICVAAALASGTTRITGAGELRVKESDRISAMTAELTKMGVKVDELDDGLIIEGRKELVPATTDSHGDHRIAMSMAIAGLAAGGVTVIENTDCVNTSFPQFVGLLESLS
jgi:3-phosphoshikimate 1-carboxyvinyltransferase